MSQLFLKVSMLAALAAASFAVAAPVSAEDTNQARPQSRCAFVRSINNFKEVDEYTAIVETSPRRRFLVRFVNSCRELKWAWTARVEAHGSVCLGMGDKIVVGRHPFRERCVVRSVEPLPPKVKPVAY